MFLKLRCKPPTPGDRVEWAIATFTAGWTPCLPVCHAVLVTSIGQFSATKSRGVFLDPLAPLPYGWWEITLWVEETPEMLAKLLSMVGWQYDELAAFLSAFGRVIEIPGHGMCSDVCAHIISLGEPDCPVNPNPAMLTAWALESIAARAGLLAVGVYKETP
jgi:hypothetical protein